MRPKYIPSFEDVVRRHVPDDATVKQIMRQAVVVADGMLADQRAVIAQRLDAAGMPDAAELVREGGKA